MMLMRSAAWYVVVFVLLCSLLPFQTRGDKSTPDCSAELVELAPCLLFVSDQTPNPSKACCDALETVVMNASACLCELVERGKNGTANTGLPAVNLTLVRQLPKDCGVQTQTHQDEAQCRAGYGAPAPSPDAPAGSTGSPIIVPTVLASIAWALITGFEPFFTLQQLCSLPTSTLNSNCVLDQFKLNAGVATV